MGTVDGDRNMKIVQVDAWGNPITGTNENTVVRFMGTRPPVVTPNRVKRTPCRCRDKVKAAIRAAAAVGKSLLEGGEIRTGDEWERIMTICTACPTLTLDDLQRRWCGPPMIVVEGQSCGCLVNLKTRLVTEKCPQGRW